MLAQIQSVCVVRLNILIIGSTCNGKAVLGPSNLASTPQSCALGSPVAACYGELRSFVDGEVDLGADINDAQVIALKDQAHALQ
jgi:hypothetical protein